MPEFDQFYLDARRGLLLQTFALTGDLTASRAAVHDAFVAAGHHWRKVRHLESPIEWVRPRAWSIAQRRSVGRIWHRVKDADDQQKQVLKALSQLPEDQRRILILTQLTQTPPSKLGREVGLPLAEVARQQEEATTALAGALSCEAFELAARLHTLDPLVARHGLPRASAIQRQGHLRRRRHLVAGVAGAVVMTTLAGWFVTPSSSRPSLPGQDNEPPRPVVAGQLLDAPTTSASLAPGGAWRVVDTSTNTDGDGINVVCQQERFADAQGEASWVRTLANPANPARTVTHSVEVSSTPGAAAEAFDTASGWYSGCTQPGVQLSRVFRIDGVGEEATAYKFRVPAAPRGSYYVLLARKGMSLSTVALLDRSSKTQTVQAAAGLLGVAVDRLCNTDAVPQCSTSTPEIVPVPPPRSGEGDGMLATTDLPPVRGIDKGWVGTPITPAESNVARTICDNTDFARAGATEQHTRTFLIPQAKVPPRFGLTETYARFASPQAARKVYNQILNRMGSCEDRQLGTSISHAKQQPKGYLGTSFALWRVTNEINRDQEEVAYWMGVSLVGPYVAQVNFTPAGRRDIGQDIFRDLIARSRDRLLELPR